MTAPNMERICELNVSLSSPLEIDDSLFLVAQNGEIYKLKENQLKVNKKKNQILISRLNFVFKVNLHQ